jgi:hypothetical protein
VQSALRHCGEGDQPCTRGPGRLRYCDVIAE